MKRAMGLIFFVGYDAIKKADKTKRPVTDNDFGNKMQLKNIEWKKASLFSEATNTTLKTNKNGQVELNVTYFYQVFKLLFYRNILLVVTELLKLKTR